MNVLEDLCKASGVSGNEDEVRNYLRGLCSYYNPTVDVMGNLLVSTGGKGKKILFAAHMDEVGLIISEIEDSGFLRFKTVGGIDTGVLIGKKVFIGAKKTVGIIGIRAVHLQGKNDEMNEESLYIDIGAENKEDAESVVSLGDYACFEHVFKKFGDNLLAAKALDNRAGCAIMAELLKRDGAYNLCFAFTAQEETGCRGAAAAADYFEPDLAVIIETTICADTYPTESHKTPTSVGKGPVITFLDRTSVPDRDVMNSLIEMANMQNIPWQFKKTNMGGTDAGSVSRALDGIPTAVVALPCRNLHSPVTVISMNDFMNLFRLLDLWIKDLG